MTHGCWDEHPTDPVGGGWPEHGAIRGLRFVVPEPILRKWALETVQRQLERRLQAVRALATL